MTGRARPGADLVIFDNDGVVVDSELLANGVLAALLTELGHPTTLEQSIATYLGGTVAGVRAIVEARSGASLPGDFEDTYHRARLRRLRRRARPRARDPHGARGHWPPRTAWPRRGQRQRIVRSLTVTGLLGFFEDRIFSAEDVAHGKPAPDLFLHTASRMGTAPGRCVVVEDSTNGVEAARAAGMRVLGYAALDAGRAAGGRRRRLRLHGRAAPAPGHGAGLTCRPELPT